MTASSSRIWRNGNFLKLWYGETVSQFGMQIAVVAIPLTAALTLKANAMQVGVLSACEYLPYLLFGLFAGIWVDRYKTVPIMIAADFVRAMLLLVIPITALAGILQITILFGVAFGVGVCNLFFEIAYVSFMPSILSQDELIAGNSRLAASRSAAQVAGPGLSGTLIQLLNAPISIFVTAGTFLVAGLAIASMRLTDLTSRRATGEHEHMLHQLRVGIQCVLKEPIILAISRTAILWNASWSIIFTVFVLYITRDVGLKAGQVGIIYASSGLGLLVGAIYAEKLMNRLGVGRTLIWSGILAATGGPFLPLMMHFQLGAMAFMMFGQLILGFGSCIFGIAFVSLRQSIVPVQVMGRVTGVTRFAISGAHVFGALTGGFLGRSLGLRSTIVFGIVGLFASVFLLFLRTSSLYKIRSFH